MHVNQKEIVPIKDLSFFLLLIMVGFKSLYLDFVEYIEKTEPAHF